MSEPLVSVIIPVYGTEEYLDECLRSIVNQTYKNLQIIIVNDASPGNANEILENYLNEDSRIKVICHEENKGLFQTRLTGYRYAKGEYIASIDSDDYVNLDYFRILVNSIESSDSDIVIADYAIRNQKGQLAMRGYASAINRHQVLTDEQVFSSFVQENFLLSSHRWFVVTKIYKKSLWDSAYKFLSAITDNINMLEDLLFGFVFSSLAKKVISIDDVGMYYRINPNSISRKHSTYDEIMKQVYDTKKVFDIIKKYLISCNLYEISKPAMDNYINKNADMYIGWTNNLPINALKKGKYIQEIKKSLGIAGDISFQSNALFYRANTTYDARLEHIKKIIISPEIEIVSFDIFDTLIKRPFYEPKDLFCLMNRYYEEVTGRKELHGFDKIRIECERTARKRINTSNPDWQDVNIHEIYEEIGFKHCLSYDIIEKLKHKEIELELQFCTARAKVKDLYELAAYLGKRIIIISDMYLSADVIELMLQKNGYTSHEKLFVSSEIRLGKWTTALFHHAIDYLGVSPESILHIGDNWAVDIERAKKLKIRTGFVPKGIELFQNKIGPYKMSNYTNLFKNSSGNWARYQFAPEHFSLKCMLGVVISKFYDNPWPSYTENANFNCDPFMVGYSALGPHNLAFAKWLLDNAQKKKYNKIHFIARDGYLLQKIVEVILPLYEHRPEINYLYFTRKSSLIMLINHESDFYGISDTINYTVYTPREILEMFKGALLETTTEIETAYRKNGVELDLKMDSTHSFHDFIASLISLSYDKNYFDAHKKKICDYFNSMITDNDCLFDVGYSGKMQAIIRSALGKKCDAYFLMTKNDSSYDKANRYDFEIFSFLGYVPSASITVMEVLMSDTAASCKGYEFDDDGKVVPVFEDGEMSKAGKLVIGNIHKGVVQFVKDFAEIYGDFFHTFHMDAHMSSSIYDYFLHQPKSEDIQMLSCIEVEKNLSNPNGFLVDYWLHSLKSNNIMQPKNKIAVSYSPTTHNIISNAAKWKKAIFYLLFDKNEFKAKLYEKLQGRPVLFSIARNAYRFLKKIRRIGKPKEKKFIIDTKTDLYYAMSNFNILCCILHKICFNADKPAILMIHDYRKDRYEALKKTGFFDDVLLFSEATANEAIKKYSPNEIEKNIDTVSKKILRIVDELLPFDIRAFDEIHLISDHYLLGAYCVYNKIKYNYFEDGTGTYTYNDLIRLTQEKFTPIQPFLIDKFGLLGKNNSVKKRFVKYSSQTKEFKPDSSFVDFSAEALLTDIPEFDLKKILSVYNGQKIKTSPDFKYAIILTQPFVSWQQLDEESHKMLYSILVDYFLQGYKIIIKPHPTDRIDYKSFIKDTICINPSLIAELLPFVIERPFDLGITVSTDAIHNMGNIINNKIFFNLEFSQDYIVIHKYYVACQYILNSNHFGNVYAEGLGGIILRNLFFIAGGYEAKINVSSENMSNIIVIQNAPSEDMIYEHNTVICFTEPSAEIAFKEAICLQKIEIELIYSDKTKNAEYIYILQGLDNIRDFKNFNYDLLTSRVNISVNKIG